MTEHPAGVDELVDALVDGTVPIALILEHMRTAPTQPTPTDARATLVSLLGDTLEPLATRFGSEALLAAAAVVQATGPLIEDEILLVPHEPTNRATRRAARRPRGGRTSPRRP